MNDQKIEGSSPQYPNTPNTPNTPVGHPAEGLLSHPEMGLVPIGTNINSPVYPLHFTQLATVTPLLCGPSPTWPD